MDKINSNILVVDDDPDILQTAKVVLRPYFGIITTEMNPKKIPFLLNQSEYEVVMLDMNFSAGATDGSEGLDWIRKIQQIDPAINVIMMTAYGQINLAVDAMKEGATDFVVKPWENEKLIATVHAASKFSKTKQEIKLLKTRQEHLNQIDAMPIIGDSLEVKNLFKIIEKVAPTDANLLILGENGTGKDLFAKAIHNASSRKNEIFLKVDLGSISETLFESELFGHVKGAFTDAKEDRAGRFEMANGGTLFLDEIGNLSLALQSKLLTALQNRQVSRVGSSQVIEVDVRIISATNVPIPKLIQEKKFREDLLFRLNTVEIAIPPLRERASDIPLLTKHFLKMYSKKYNKSGISIGDETLKFLQTYSWPGNIRELQHAVERAVIMSERPRISKNDFLLTQLPSPVSSHDTLNLDQREKQAIVQALKKFNGNMSKAAAALGLGRTTLYRKIQKYDL